MTAKRGQFASATGRPHLRRLRALLCILLACFSAACLHAAGQTLTLTFATPQTAGICGMRPFWDRPVVLRRTASEYATNAATRRCPPCRLGRRFNWNVASSCWTAGSVYDDPRPGAIVFDAVQRSLLLRFPESAQKIADAVNRGYAIEKVELLLPFDGTETAPLGYRRPSAATAEALEYPHPALACRRLAVAQTLARGLRGWPHFQRLSSMAPAIGKNMARRIPKLTVTRSEFGPAEVSLTAQ